MRYSKHLLFVLLISSLLLLSGCEDDDPVPIDPPTCQPGATCQFGDTVLVVVVCLTGDSCDVPAGSGGTHSAVTSPPGRGVLQVEAELSEGYDSLQYCEYLKSYSNNFLEGSFASGFYRSCQVSGNRVFLTIVDDSLVVEKGLVDAGLLSVIKVADSKTYRFSDPKRLLGFGVGDSTFKIQLDNIVSTTKGTLEGKSVTLNGDFSEVVVKTKKPNNRGVSKEAVRYSPNNDSFSYAGLIVGFIVLTIVIYALILFTRTPNKNRR